MRVRAATEAGRWFAWLSAAMVWARRCSTMAGSKRGWVTASRSSSKPSSRLADSTRSVPPRRSSEAPKDERDRGILLPPPEGLGVERPRAVGEQVGHEVGDARPARRIRRDAAREGEGKRHDRRALVLHQPRLQPRRRGHGLDIDRAGGGGQPYQGGDEQGRQAARNGHRLPPCGVSKAVTRRSGRQTWRAAAITSDGVTAEMRCGQASMSATVPPMASTLP